MEVTRTERWKQRRRQKGALGREERQALRDRIASSAPAPSSVDGQLRRRKDAQAVAEGRDPADELDLGNEVDDEAAADAGADETEDDDMEINETPVAADPAPRPAYKPGTRVIEQPATPERALPWYARVKPGESMMAAARAEQDRMSGSKEAKRLASKVTE